MTKKESKLEKRLPKGRPKATHGGFSFLTTGRLPEHRVSLQRYLSACRNGLTEDLGGEVNMSTQELILIDRCVSILGVLRCIEEFCKEKGVFKGDELQPSLGKHYISYTNSLKQILSLLGIESRTEDKVLTMAELSKVIEEEEKDST
ncbi:MAG: hypothetical protein KAV87_52590 [Desulfobacteraceae bacterium]|nr:hypothetical protein [Desulfobacteraceae bacterium]